MWGRLLPFGYTTPAPNRSHVQSYHGLPTVQPPVSLFGPVDLRRFHRSLSSCSNTYSLALRLCGGSLEPTGMPGVGGTARISNPEEQLGSATGECFMIGTVHTNGQNWIHENLWYKWTSTNIVAIQLGDGCKVSSTFWIIILTLR